jgi:hypothetical protein
MLRLAVGETAREKADRPDAGHDTPHHSSERVHGLDGKPSNRKSQQWTAGAVDGKPLWYQQPAHCVGFVIDDPATRWESFTATHPVNSSRRRGVSGDRVYSTTRPTNFRSVRTRVWDIDLVVRASTVTCFGIENQSRCMTRGLGSLGLGHRFSTKRRGTQ